MKKKQLFDTRRKVPFSPIVDKDAICDSDGNPLDALYAKKTELKSGLAAKQDILKAGDGISIKGGVISSTINTLITPITYAELVALRNSSSLVAGMQYRIVDYDFTTTEVDTTSAHKLFDIIVTADSESVLNESARAMHHQYAEGEADSLSSRDIAAWELKYTLKNTKHSSRNGKGTVLWMKDEFRNECNYDFINALFRVHEITACAKSPSLVGTYAIETSNSNITYGANSKWVSTFGSNNHDNIIKYDGLAKIVLGNGCSSNTFGDGCSSNTFGSYCSSNTFGSYCYSITFGEECYSNTFGDECNNNIFGNSCNSNTFGSYCASNAFGDECSFNAFGEECNNNTFGDGCSSNAFERDCNSNTFGSYCRFNAFGHDFNNNTFLSDCNNNTFGNSCYSNAFGDLCNNNAFGNGCSSNTFGEEFNNNTFGDSCNSNTFGSYCASNAFGSYCYSNSFGNNCYSNTFGNECNNNIFGNSCNSNAFGSGCYHIKFASSSSATTKYNYYRYNYFGDGCQYILFKGAETASSSAQVQNYNFAQGVQGTSSAYLTIDGVRDRAYETKVAKSSSGELKIYCEADLIQ